MFFVFVSTFFCVHLLDVKFTTLLKPYFNTEVERLTTNLVNQSLNDLSVDMDYSSILLVNKGIHGEIEKLSYDTAVINQLNDRFSDSIQKKLEELESGKINNSLFFDEFSSHHFKKIKNGFLCEVRFGALRGSHLFANIGPSIPIRLQFLGQVDPDIDIQVEEYGINTILVKIFYVAKIKEQISMPFSSEQREIVVNQPLCIDIIRGSIPNRYNQFSKSNNA